MGRLIVWILVAVMLAAGLYALSRSRSEQPVQRVEKVIPADALPR